MQERLQKIIARAGLGSRRGSEELIVAGRVRVNGRVVTELGAKADPRDDKIEVDGQRIVAEAPHYVVLHKPRGVVSTLSDPEGRPTVAEYLRGAGARLYPVGRLDFATSGVLLCTNDGEFSNGLLHPRGGVPKTYVVKVNGEMQEADFERWEKGVRLEDGMTLPTEARFLRHEEGKTWFELTLREGRNQQIRRMGEATGFPVMRLARTSFAGVSSEGLRPGEWRPLTVDELLEIRKQFGVPKRVRGAVTRAPEPRPERRERGERAARPGERAAAGGKRPARPGERPARAGDHARPVEERSRRPGKPSQPVEEGVRRAGRAPQRVEDRSGRPGRAPQRVEDDLRRPGRAPQRVEEDLRRAGRAPQRVEDDLRRTGGTPQPVEDRSRRPGKPPRPTRRR